MLLIGSCQLWLLITGPEALPLGALRLRALDGCQHSAVHVVVHRLPDLVRPDVVSAACQEPQVGANARSGQRLLKGANRTVQTEIVVGGDEDMDLVYQELFPLLIDR